jgi:hypothetical protein
MSLVDDLIAALTTAGYSNFRAYPGFDSDTVDQILIRPGVGTSIPILGQADIEKPKVQIQVRDADARTAEARALAIKALLDNNLSLSNSLFCKWDGRALDYWFDDNNLNIFSMNFTIIRR